MNRLPLAATLLLVGCGSTTTQPALDPAPERTAPGIYRCADGEARGPHQ